MSSLLSAVGICWLAGALVALLTGKYGSGREMMIIGVLFLIASDVRDVLGNLRNFVAAARKAGLGE